MNHNPQKGVHLERQHLRNIHSELETHKTELQTHSTHLNSIASRIQFGTGQMMINGVQDNGNLQQLKCEDGRLRVKSQVARTEDVLAFNTVLTSSQLYGVGIDCTDYRSLRVMGVATLAFNLYGSTDEIHWYKIDAITPDAGHSNHYHYHLENPPKYVRVKNGLSSNTLTMYYGLVN